MYSFCRDIRFLEQLEESKKGFENNIFIALVDNKAFYRGNSEPEKIYSYFRDKKPHQQVVGSLDPTVFSFGDETTFLFPEKKRGSTMDLF